MGFDLGLKPTKEDAIQFKMFYEGRRRILQKGDEAPLDTKGQPAAYMTFYLIPMTGRTHLKIADEMVEMDQKKGTAFMRTGTAAKHRIINSVIWIDGLELNGKEVTRLDDGMYFALPVWCINGLGEKLDEINGDQSAASLQEG